MLWFFHQIVMLYRRQKHTNEQHKLSEEFRTKVVSKNTYRIVEILGL